MARKGLTAKKLENLAGKRRNHAIRLWEGGRTGFGVKVSAAGRLTFFQSYSSPAGTIDERGKDISGKRRFMTLGTFSKAYGLAKARDDATEARALLHKGIDPQEKVKADRKQASGRAQAEAARGTMASVAALMLWYFKRKKRTDRYINDVRRAWRRDVFPIIPREKKAADVTPQDIREILHRPLSRKAEQSGRTLRASLHLAFKLAMRADHDPRNLNGKVKFEVTSNPVEPVPMDATAKPRNRELSFDEIGRVWNDIPQSADYPLDTLLIRLLLALGGQHITELREATWDEFDFENGRWLIRADRHKNRTRDHLLPIRTIADGLLRELHELTGHSRYLFPQISRDSQPMRIERPGIIIQGYHAWREKQGAKAMEPFTAADLRRTCTTRMHEIGISKFMTNHLHNHDFSGVSAKHYDRWDYWEEKQIAMAAWDSALKSAIVGKAILTEMIRASVRSEATSPESKAF